MWPDADTTQDLLSLARQGDGAAVERLLARHRAALRRMIDLRLDPALRRRVDASDIVQDVLVDANRRLEAYLADPAMPFHLWLHHMAKDRIIDAHRRHRQAARRSMDREQPLAGPGDASRSRAVGPVIVDPAPTPAADAAWRELEGRFAAAVEQLDDNDREIVLLRHFEQLSNADAAELLKLSPPAASMRYIRAMRRLRGLLGDEIGEKEPS